MIFHGEGAEGSSFGEAEGPVSQNQDHRSARKVARRVRKQKGYSC